jgi:C-terminal processing protease CtpA/Prc
VQPDGAAAKEAPRIRSGDVITKINSKSLEGMHFDDATAILKVK